MAWVMLICAGLFEVGFTTALHYTEGFTKLVPTAAFIGFASVSFYLPTKAA